MAGNLGSDKIQLEVIIDGSPARKELAELSKATARLREEQEKLKQQQDSVKGRRSLSKDAAEIKQLAAEEAKLREERRKGIDAIAENQKKMAELRKDIGLTALSYRELQQRQMSLRNTLKAGAASLGTDEYNRLEAELVDVERQMGRLNSAVERQIRVWDRQRVGMKLTQMTGEQLEMEIKRLQLAISRTPAGDVMGLKRLRAELTAAQKGLDHMRTGLGPFGRLWSEVKGQVAAAGAVMVGMLGAGGIVNGFRGLVRSAAEYSDALSDVRKTTGLSTPVVKELANELGKIDTRTSRAELLSLARDAGKLGISAKEDVLAFVKAGNQINVALGEDLGADAIKSIAKLVDLFNLKEQFGLESAMLKVGSAINELGMASTASEGYMVEFLKRMGGIAPIAGITIEQTLALGATLDSLGQTSEVSSTALSKLFVKLGTDSEKYARLAGLNVGAFEKILKENALEAFIAVLDGTKKTEGGVVSLAETLGDMGIDAARAAGVFGVLSQNTDRLREQMGLANDAFAEGTSITDEAAEKNANLAAQLEKLGKEFNRLFANNTMVAWLTRMVGTTREAISWMQRHKDAITFFLKVLANAAVAWTSYRIAIAAAARIQAIAAAATRAYGIIMSVFRGQVTAAAAATQLFNTAIRLNPIGLVISALTTAIALFASFTQEVETATEKQAALNSNLEKFKDLTAQREDIDLQLRAVETLNERQLQALQEQVDAEIKLQEDRQARFAAANKEDIIAYKRSREALVEAQAAGDSILEDRRRVGYEANLRNLGRALGAQLGLVDGYGRARIANEAEVNAILEGEDVKTLRNKQKRINDQIALVRTGATGELRTLATINAEIKALEDQFDASSTTKQYAEIQRKIDALERERDRITGAKRKGRESQEAAHLDKLLAEYQQFQGQLRADTLNADAKELEELDLKHAAELDKVRAQQAELIKAKKLSPEQAQTDLNTLSGQQGTERDTLVDAQTKRRLEAIIEANKKVEGLLKEHGASMLKGELEIVEQSIAMAEQKGQATVELERRRADLLLRIAEQNATDLIEQEKEKFKEYLDAARKALDDYDTALSKKALEPSDDELADRQKLADAITALETALGLKINQIREKNRRDDLESERAYGQAVRMERVKALQQFAQVADSIGSLFQSIAQMRAADLTLAEQQADADGVRTTEEIARIERIKRERRRAALTAIAVQGAAAIANGVASAMTLQPWPVALAAAISTVATVVGLMAQARALMATDNGGSQPQQQGQQQQGLQNVPWGERGLARRPDGTILMADGGTVPSKKQLNAGLITSDAGGGVLGGNLHRDGGNTLYDNKTGSPLAEVEKDELLLVLSRKATAANADLIPMLLKASREGTRINTFSQPLPMPNLTNVRRAVAPSMAGGGVVGQGTYTFSKSTGLRPESGNGWNELLEVNRELLSESRATRRAAERFKEVKAPVSIIDINRKSKEYDDLRAANSSRR